MSNTPHLDKLSKVLFDGPVKVDNIDIFPGTDPNVTSEQLAAEMYASMERIGLIKDGNLVLDPHSDCNS